MKIYKNNAPIEVPIEIVNTSENTRQLYYIPLSADFEHIKTMYENGLLKIRLHKKQAS